MTNPLLPLRTGLMGGVLTHAQGSVQLNGTYSGRHCKECVEGLMAQKSLLQCCQGLIGCIHGSWDVSLK